MIAMIWLPNMSTDKAMTTIHIRLANSPSSPPNADMAPDAASAITPIALAAGPLNEQASVFSGPSHGNPAKAKSGHSVSNAQGKKSVKYRRLELLRVFMIAFSLLLVTIDNVDFPRRAPELSFSLDMLTTPS